MKFEIKNRFTGKVQFTAGIKDSGTKATNIRLAVEWALKNKVDLSRADLSGADLSEADLSGADLIRANLSGADFSRADLSRADLSGADLSRADLSGADLSGADLSGADLSGANLIWADLSGADLSGADFSRANLIGANLSRANLNDAGLVVLSLPIWTAYISKEHVRIGCKYHTHKEWLSFTDVEIAAMDKGALSWWKIHKPLIVAGIGAVKAQESIK